MIVAVPHTIVWLLVVPQSDFFLIQIDAHDQIRPTQVLNKNARMHVMVEDEDDVHSHSRQTVTESETQIKIEIYQNLGPTPAEKTKLFNSSFASIAVFVYEIFLRECPRIRSTMRSSSSSTSLLLLLL